MNHIRIGRIVTVAGLAGLAGVYIRAFADTPVERVQGVAQKIMYVHVPAAWTTMLAVALVGLASILFLLVKDERYDRFAAAAAEVGTMFAVVMLTTGPLWAKPVWGTWWTWDARLTFTLFLFLILVGYQLLRGAVTDAGLRARYAAVLGICALVLLPFIHLSVYLFRTLHPRPVVLRPEGPQLPAEMLTTLMLGVGAFTVLAVGFLLQRYGIGGEREEPSHG
jgi:heme exporter protein C